MYTKLPTYNTSLIMPDSDQAPIASSENNNQGWSSKFWVYFQQFLKFWDRFKQDLKFWRWDRFVLRKISHANLCFQIVTLVIVYSHLDPNFHEQPGRLAVFWLSLLNNTLITGVIGQTLQVLISYTEEVNSPSKEVRRETALQNAFFSFVPWISAAISI